MAGGIYLLHVAARLWRSGSIATEAGVIKVSPTAAFRMGFFTNIMNPKSALFFGSVFATSLPAQPPTALLLSAIGVVVLNALCWHLFLAFAFSRSGVRTFYARQRSALNRIAGVLVGAFGLRLLISASAESRAP